MSTEETENTAIDEINTVFEEMATEEVQAKAEEAEAKADAKDTEGSQESEKEEEVTSATEEASEEISNESKEIEESGESTEKTGEEGPGGSEDVRETIAQEVHISDELLTRAAQAGIPLAHARKFENEETLLGAVEHYEKAWKEAEVETTSTKDPLSELPKLDPDVHDPQVIAQFDRLTDIIKQERETSQTEVQGMGERLQAMEDLQADTISATREAENTESAQWFDKQISGLGEDFQEALGEGGSASLNSQSKQYTNRAGIAMQISIMESGYEAQGLKVPSRDELFEKASRAVLPDEYQQIHEKKLSGKLGKRAGQHISRAGGQKVSGAQTPAESAAAELEKKFGIKP